MNTPSKFAGPSDTRVVAAQGVGADPRPPAVRLDLRAPREAYRARIADLDLVLLDGEEEILPGLELIVTPGHFARRPVDRRADREGPHVIVGMCTIAENFWPSEDVLKKGTYTAASPTGMHIDPIETYDSMQRIKAIPEARILPFHDIAVLDYTVLG